jgi:hypothetical protein
VQETKPVGSNKSTMVGVDKTNVRANHSPDVDRGRSKQRTRVFGQPGAFH